MTIPIFQRILKTCRILSLDVVIGSIISGAMVAKLFQTEMPWIWWLGLPISVWVIYTADHLLDAWRLKDQAHTPRHLFHFQYFKSILIVWSLLAFLCLTWLPWMAPKELLFLGLGMGILVLIHLGLVKIIGNRISWMFHKELGVGLIYSGGVWGGGWVLGDRDVVLFEEWLFIQFLLLALLNLLIFSMYEIRTDELDGHTSFVRAIGPGNTKILIGAFSLIIIISGGWILGNGTLPEKQIVGIYGFMLIGLLLIAFRESWFGINERYRIWGDAVFLFPIIFFL